MQLSNLYKINETFSAACVPQLISLRRRGGGGEGGQ